MSTNPSTKKSSRARAAKKKSPARGRSRRRAKKNPLTRSTADRHTLYEKSVQSADVDAWLIDTIFRREVGRRARTLREDFCGTGWLCAEWVKRHRENRALGLDLDRPVLAWGMKKHIEPLGDKAARVELRRQNVLAPSGGRYDAICAYNYSYFTFKDRDTLRRYFRMVRRHLVSDGLFFLDAFGGAASQRIEVEERRQRGFDYRWDQASFNPVDYAFLAHIHFAFDDGTEWKKAFTYDWRLWQLVEIQEVLREAGFRKVHVYWEDEDRRGRGKGTFRRRDRVSPDETWNAYLVAHR